MNGKPETREAVPDIPPGFQPMPAMVTVPILGHTARLQPITAKGNIKDECSAYAVECK